MKKNLLILLVYVCALFSCKQEQTLDNLLTKFETENKAMGTVSILKDGIEVYQKSIGFANIDLKTKADKNTLYRIGSISKTFTAAIILQLVDENKIKLNTRLNKYFPNVPNAENIKIKDMLYHRSGLYNITSSKGFETWISKPRKRNEMLTKIAEEKSIFKPDTKTEYSNTNYILLAYIAEDIDQQTFSEILQNRISKKLNLQNTYFGKNLDVTKNEAMCYYPENNQWYPISFHTNLTGTMGAGGITSTATEVNTFYSSLFTGKIISKNSLKKMTKANGEMGMGISVIDHEGVIIYGHDGAIDGFRSIAVFAPEKNLSITFTFNASALSSTETLLQIFKAYEYTEKANINNPKN